MNQEKFGKFIKEIRKKHNLTQKQFADKYNVTYQAVSKWETGKNLPDNALIKQISKDFDVSLEELYDGEFSKQKKEKKSFLFLGLSIFIILSITTTIVINTIKKENNFEFKTLSTECKNFNISGNIAYNDNKSAIYITNIKYCGGNDIELYKKIECTLYESHNDIARKISSYNYQGKENIKLEDFLEQVTFTIDNYEKVCKEYKDNTLYLSINATMNNDKIITYKIPLKLKNNCSN